jgi:hypothetical protein
MPLPRQPTLQEMRRQFEADEAARKLEHLRLQARELKMRELDIPPVPQNPVAVE